MLRNCIYHLCDDAVPLFHVRKRRFPIQLPGLSKNHESERNQLMKKSNRKKFLQFVVLVLFLAALFVPQDANRLLIAGIALIGIGVTLFSYLLPLFTERLKNREHKLRKRPERTRHLEGTPDLETILWRQIKFQITGKLKEAFPDATWDFVKEPPLSQILDGEPLRIRTRNTGSYNFAEILMDARGSLTLQMMTIESLHKKQKQLVEKSMDLVPIMIRSMTRTAAYVTEEEQQELCQIGYLALCRSAVGFEEGRSFQPYAKTIIRHAIFDYWRKIARDRSMLCSLDEASSEDEHLHYRDLFSYEDTQTTHPEKDTNQTLLLEHLTQLGTGQSSTIQKGIVALYLQQQGYTSFDLAKHYQVPANRVRAWQSKARKLLQQDDALYALLT